MNIFVFHKNIHFFQGCCISIGFVYTEYQHGHRTHEQSVGRSQASVFSRHHPVGPSTIIRDIDRPATPLRQRSDRRIGRCRVPCPSRRRGHVQRTSINMAALRFAMAPERAGQRFLRESKDYLCSCGDKEDLCPSPARRDEIAGLSEHSHASVTMASCNPGETIQL